MRTSPSTPGGLGGSSIKEIALPDSVEELGWNAFTDSKTLQTVSWPNNAAFTTIPEQAFEGCEQLDDNVVATLPPSVKTIDYRAFANCGVPQFYVSDTTVLTFTQIDVPGTVERVERQAFLSFPRFWAARSLCRRSRDQEMKTRCCRYI